MDSVRRRSRRFTADRSRRGLEARFETGAACNMSSRGRPELLQFCVFITMIISPIQLNFDGLDFVLLWQSDSVVDLGIELIARTGQPDLSVEIEATLLQFVRAPILIN